MNGTQSKLTDRRKLTDRSMSDFGTVAPRGALKECLDFQGLDLGDAMAAVGDGLAKPTEKVVETRGMHATTL